MTLASGARVLLCGDAILSRANIDRDNWGRRPIPRGACERGPSDRARAAQDALMIFGHDPVQMHELRYGREAYV